MTAIANLPDLRPSLLLDFANSGRVDPRIQCTRASSATCFGPDGKLRTVAANVPRIDHDPVTGKCLGLLSESQRSNLLTNSVALSGYSQGSNGTYSAGRIGIDGITPSMRVVANAQGYVALSKVVTVEAGAYTASIYFCADAKPAHGSLIYIQEMQADGSIVVKTLPFADVSVIADGVWRRYELTVTHAAAGACGVFFSVDPSVGDSIDLCAAQYEAGGNASSYIPTEGSAVTRASDFTRMSLRNWPASYTVLMEVDRCVVRGSFPRYVSVSVGSYAHEFFIAEGESSLILGSAGGQGITSGAIPSSNAEGSLKLALTYDATQQILYGLVSGNLGSSFTASGFAPTELSLGCGPAGYDALTTQIKRAAVYPVALSFSEMQRLTA